MRVLILPSVIRYLFAISAIVIFLGAAAARAHAQAEPPDVYQPPNAQPPASAKEDFMRNCASCHGANGRGHGPDVKMLGIKPSDLTAISLRNGGIFPYQQVEDTIDGRKTIPGHKRFDMPFWGTTMQPEGQEFTPASEAKVKARIDAMVDYIRSIQRQ
jgi:mono/diheme cytochrome c family protein